MKHHSLGTFDGEAASVFRRLFFALFGLALLLAGSPASRAQNTTVVTTVHGFTGQDGEGDLPYAGVIEGSDGNFYGTTDLGGANNTGTIYQMTLQGIVTVLHSFSATGNQGINTDGANPQTVLVESTTTGGTFYGVAYTGGIYGYGTLFKVTSGGVFSVLHSFRDTASDGAHPNSLIVGSDGNFYGTTVAGSTTVFRYSGAGIFSTLYSFTSSPTAFIQGSDGNFYGTTEYGGTNGRGTIFEVTSAGVFTVLYNFSSTASNTGDNVDGRTRRGASYRIATAISMGQRRWEGQTTTARSTNFLPAGYSPRSIASAEIPPTAAGPRR